MSDTSPGPYIEMLARTTGKSRLLAVDPINVTPCKGPKLTSHSLSARTFPIRRIARLETFLRQEVADTEQAERPGYCLLSIPPQAGSFLCVRMSGPPTYDVAHRSAPFSSGPGPRCRAAGSEKPWPNMDARPVEIRSASSEA